MLIHLTKVINIIIYLIQFCPPSRSQGRPLHTGNKALHILRCLFVDVAALPWLTEQAYSSTM